MSHVRKTSVAVDDELVRAVQRVLGTSSLRETIERAFREVLAARAREDDIAAMTTLSGLDLADRDVMDGAWRT